MSPVSAPATPIIAKKGAQTSKKARSAEQNQDTIQRFYDAFAAKDHETMAECYHPDVAFSDPVFQDLKGWKASAMWRMLCERGTDLEVRSSNIKADDSSGQAHWDADYTFSQTGREVNNFVDASFEFRDGKIIGHEDDFGLWRWTRQALGMSGVLLGWLPPFQKTIRNRAMKGLESYIEQNNLGPEDFPNGRASGL